MEFDIAYKEGVETILKLKETVMKNFVKNTVVACAALLPLNLVADAQNEMQIDEATYLGLGKVEVNFQYAGGCIDRTFELAFDNFCAESYPQQCNGYIKDVTEQIDPCVNTQTTEETIIFDVPEELKKVRTILNLDGIDVALFADIKDETTITNLEVNRFDRPNTPELTGFRVTGKVMLGGNRCLAEGVQAELNAEFKDNELVLTPYLLIDEYAAYRFCTKEFMPVYRNVTATVNANFTEIDVIRVNHYETWEQDFIFPIPEDRVDMDITIRNVNINPVTDVDKTYMVTGTVRLGNNPCQALGIEAKLVTEVVNGEALITPKLTAPNDYFTRTCTMEWAPVDTEVELKLDLRNQEVELVKVMNFEDLGNEFIQEM